MRTKRNEFLSESDSTFSYQGDPNDRGISTKGIGQRNSASNIPTVDQGAPAKIKKNDQAKTELYDLSDNMLRLMQTNTNGKNNREITEMIKSIKSIILEID